ncbi:MAG TPA: ADP-ribosylglycohydrolase family protein [Cellvibrio sp.]|nr:ADP-ribosylglycohydrolase family protein [Cellvibrio sp.]
MDLLDKAKGSLVGLAVGDAVGTTLEFRQRGTFEPITDMVGGGPFDLLPGQWTDDTSMALCLAHSLLHKNGFDPVDQMNRYCNWYQYGYMSSTGECFDIGATVATALNAYMKTGNPFSGSIDERSSGNGSLMRLAPIAIFYRDKPAELIRYAGESSRTTHGSAECIDACKYFASLLVAAMTARNKEELLATFYQPTTSSVSAIASGLYLEKSYEQLTGSGYVIESLESALWCFHKAESFEEAILLAANIGNDADTTAAICGQIAGAFYGCTGIPGHWAGLVQKYENIHGVADTLFNLHTL